VPLSRLGWLPGFPTATWKDAVETRWWEKWVNTPASEEVGCKLNWDSEQNESSVFIQVNTGHLSTTRNHCTIQKHWQALAKGERDPGGGLQARNEVAQTELCKDTSPTDAWCTPSFLVLFSWAFSKTELNRGHGVSSPASWGLLVNHRLALLLS
jgi:hypothetical protein